MTPRVELPKHLAEEFKVAAKAAFPREEYAIILGKATKGGVYRPSFLYFPPDREPYCTEDKVDVQYLWWDSARKAAKDQNLSILGDLHSHPWPEGWEPNKTCEPSAADLDRWWFLHKKTRRKNPIMGICSVFPSARGLECLFRFWSAPEQPELVIS